MQVTVRRFIALVICFLCGTLSTYANSFTFAVFDVPGAIGETVANGINNSGQVVGYFQDSSGTPQGFLRDVNGSLTYINVPNAHGTHASGINDLGQIVGYFAHGNHGFLYSGGVFTIINDPEAYPEHTWTRGINNSGAIAGNSISPSGQYAFVRDVKAGYTYLSCGINTATIANAINNNGHVVGYCGDFNHGPSHGFLGTVTGITTGTGITTQFDVPGATNTFALGINDHGDVVGYFYDGLSTTNGRGFLRNAAGQFTIIDVPGATGDTRITGINNQGQIVGYFYDQTGAHGFVATPVSTPEPSTLLLVLSGLAAVHALQLCRHHPRRYRRL